MIKRRLIAPTLMMLLVAFFCALFISYFHQPVGFLPVKNPYLTQWIGGGTDVNRGYFRQHVRLSGSAEHAWLTLAAEEYTLFINGRNIAANKHVTNASFGLQGRLSEVWQRVRQGQLFNMPRAPELKKAHNREIQLSQSFDIAKFLKPGDNVIALFVQSVEPVKFALYGEIHLTSGVNVISGNSGEWLFQPAPQANKRTVWYHPQYHDADWQVAVALAPIGHPRLSALPMSIWTQPFGQKALAPAWYQEQTGFLSSYLRRPLDTQKNILKYHQKKHDRESPNNHWLKILSNTPGSLFVDDILIGTFVPNQKRLFHLNGYVNNNPQHIRINLHNHFDQQMVTPAIQVVGQVLGQEIASQLPEWETLQQSGWHAAPIAHSTLNQLVEMLSYQPVIQWQDVLNFFSNWGLSFIVIFIVLGIFLVLRKRLAQKNIFSTNLQPVAWVVGFGLFSLFATLMLMVIFYFRFQESDSILWFLTPETRHYWQYLPLVVGGFAMMTAFLIQRMNQRGLTHQAPVDWGHQTFSPHSILLFFILLLGCYLRAQGLGQIQLQADENVSWDAAIGILKHGVPEAVSGVWYTRSPLYHYLLAGWLKLFGNDIVVARLYSNLFGLAAVGMSYVLTAHITRKKHIALFAALLMAVDPWLTQVSSAIRFYQQLQFFSLLSVYFFIRGFIDRSGKGFQNAFFVSCLAAVLSQEVFVTAFPAFGIAWAIWYRPFDWRRDINIVIGFVTVMVLSIFDIFVFSVLCLTPHVGVATTSGSIMQLHLGYLDSFALGLFVGNNRANIIYGMLFLLGFFYFFKRKNHHVLFLYMTVFLTLITSTVLVLQIAARYLYGVYPYVLIVSAILICTFVDRSAHFWRKKISYSQITAEPHLLNGISIAFYAVILLCLVTHVEPTKYLRSFESGAFIAHLENLETLKKMKRSGDKIMTTHPMPVAIVFGQLDYYLMEMVYFDEIYTDNNKVKDRWAGGQLVSKIDHIREVFLKNDRVWVLLDEFEAKKISKEMQRFIELSTVNVQEFFGVKLMLWDKSLGILALSDDQGGAYDLY